MLGAVNEKSYVCVPCSLFFLEKSFLGCCRSKNNNVVGCPKKTVGYRFGFYKESTALLITKFCKLYYFGITLAVKFFFFWGEVS